MTSRNRANRWLRHRPAWSYVTRKISPTPAHPDHPHQHVTLTTASLQSADYGPQQVWQR